MARLLRSVAEAAAALKRGQVLLMPTDTLPGLHCRADAIEAVARIAAIKERPADKPFLLLAASLDQAAALTTACSPRVRVYVGRCWPGPHTLILPAAEDLPVGVVGGGSGIALRVPAVAILREAIAAATGPLVSTSANRKGLPAAIDLAAAAEEFGSKVDAIWQPSLAGWPEGTAAPSSLIDLRVWPPQILRRGLLPPPPFD